MIKPYLKKSILTGILAIAISGLSTTYSFANDDYLDNEDFFSEENVLHNESLDSMRGGFIASNGMIVDFVFSANTLVNGEIVNQVTLNSLDTALNSGSLQNIIQIGNNNSSFSGAIDSANLPNVLTIVQNNLDDLTIQQVNLLDLNVQNFSNYVEQSIAPQLNFQNSLGLAP